MYQSWDFWELKCLHYVIITWAVLKRDEVKHSLQILINKA